MENNFNNNVFAFIASGARVKVHYHHCLQIVVSLNNPYDCIINGNSIKNNMGFIINQTIRHSCEAPQSQVLVLKINAASTLGIQLKNYLDGAPFVELNNIFPPEYFQSIFQLPSEKLNKEQLQKGTGLFLERLLKECGLPQILVVQNDIRIAAALEYIYTNIDSQLNLQHIADVMHLSKDRARHFFIEQLRSPFMQYVLWLRIRKILEAVMYQNINLATACVQFGFTDQSHFTRIFKRLYGVPPTALLKHARFI